MSVRETTVSRRVKAGLGALAGALLLALVPLPSGPVQAAEAPPADVTAEDSAVTKTGKKGPYDDFSGLQVTVHQTRNLRAQGVEVSWTGQETSAAKYMNFLQIMQCWGDDPAGPEREQCEFGANNAGERFMGLRALPRGLDPGETEYTEAPGGGNPFVPFRPVVGEQTDSGTDWTYFTNNDTNTQPWLRTRQDGTGEAIFEVKTALEAPHLGCGEVDPAAGRTTPRRCWLVVVPRGTHDPDGSSDIGTGLKTSGLSQSNWDQRMVFPMDFGPVGNTCDADKAERRVIGSELLTDAITSWQTRLCSGADARFTFSQAGEEYTRGLISNPTPSSPGLGITVAPVEGGTEVVHAPVAVSALTVGFFWEDGDAGQVHDLKLSPRLLAKLLTGSYPYDVRQITFQSPVPKHLEGNALSIIVDPEFRELNPYFERPTAPQLGPDGILLQAGNSDVNSLVWRYLQSDTDAREFLQGKPDPWGMKVNPSYRGLGLDKDAPFDFPKADPTETEVSLALGGDQTGKISYGQQEKSPYSNDLHNGALRIRRGASGATFVPAQDPNSPGGVKLVTSDAIPGDRRTYGIVDAASASRYELDVAALANADGQYVKPTADALLKAVDRMPDSAVKGVKAPTPATAKGGAYPLAAVAYAVAPLDQPAKVRQDYARLIRYAAGAGQTPGLAPGELPPGYAPLPEALRDQASAAADQLERGKPAAPGDDESAPNGSGGAGGGDGAGGGSAGGAGDGTAAAGGTADEEAAAGGSGTDAPSASATPGAAAAGGGPGPAKSVAASSGGLTPGEVLGIVRWVLLGVLVAGGVAALAGPVLLRLSVRRAATGGSG
ncbi:hypothetical protein [Streptomyces sp. NBC_00872]|uniref:hypothetical protein n=1 Tax=Streptomyces sp. NBC_00872 TaxID=2903686 RepID=UPI003868DB75|nr:hypothetical protein OG214_12415 [Streptomyces sp. NBC_00872]